MQTILVNTLLESRLLIRGHII